MAYFLWHHPIQEEFNNLYEKIVQKKAEGNRVGVKETALNENEPKTTESSSLRGALKDNAYEKIDSQSELPVPPTVRPPLLPLAASSRSKLTATVSPTVNQPKNAMPSSDKFKCKKTPSAIEKNESHLMCQSYPVYTGQQFDSEAPSTKCTQGVWRSPDALQTPVIQNNPSNNSAKHGSSKNRSPSPETGYESDSSGKSGITFRTSRSKKGIKSTRRRILSLKRSSKSELKSDSDDSRSVGQRDREQQQNEKYSQEAKHFYEQSTFCKPDHEDCRIGKDKAVICNRASENTKGLIYNKTLEAVKAMACNKTLDKDRSVMFKRTPSKLVMCNKLKTDVAVVYNKSLRGDNALVFNRVSAQQEVTTSKMSERDKVTVVKKISGKNKAAIFNQLSQKDKSFMFSKDLRLEKATSYRKGIEREDMTMVKETLYKDKSVMYNKTLKEVIHRETTDSEEAVVYHKDSQKNNTKKNNRINGLQKTTDERLSGLSRNLDTSGIVARDDKVRSFKRKMDSQLKATNKRAKQKSLQSSLKVDDQSKMDSPQSIKDAGKRSAMSDVLHSPSASNCPGADSFTALENLENKLGHKKPIEDMFTEPQLVGRQTCASRGLQYLSLASSHVGGIWQTIYSET